MLVGAKPKNYRDILKNEKVIGNIKKDGYFYQLIKENNQVYLFSRTVSKVTGIYAEKIENTPHLKEWAEKYLPNGTVLIGEIYYPGGTSKDVTKVMGCLPEKAIERQANDFGLIHFYLHDILKYNGEDFVLEDGTIIPNTKLTKPSAPPRSYAYCSDTAYFPRITEQIKNADVLFHEATFEESDISRAKQTHHSTAKQAAQIALDAQVKRLLIGHFSARYEDENNLLQEARSIFPQTFLANENMVFKL